MAENAAEIADTPLASEFGRAWKIAFWTSAALTLLLVGALIQVTLQGVGVWGVNIPFVWGFDLINYSWWIGVANGANLVAALLVIHRHDLRTAVNRSAHGVALFAVICAGLFPIFHLGKPWLFHWVFPFPHTFQVWPQFRSALTWDFWAISAYTMITLVFWYVGLIPDLALLRDKAQTPSAKRIYGLFALGWRSSIRHWVHHQKAYRATAVLILPLIVLMQTTVALEHAVMLVPGWHEAWQPAHFVVTGLSSGLAAVLIAAALLHWFMGLGRSIADHVDFIARALAANALVTGYIQAGWFFTALLADEQTREAALVRVFGMYGAFFWGSLALAVAAPQILWLERFRRSMAVAALIACLVNLGIWLDRFSLLVGGLQSRYLSSHSNPYWPTLVETLLFIGTLGLFAGLVLLSVRFLPAISVYEARRSEQMEGAR